MCDYINYSNPSALSGYKIVSVSNSGSFPILLSKNNDHFTDTVVVVNGIKSELLKAFKRVTNTQTI